MGKGMSKGEICPLSRAVSQAVPERRLGKCTIIDMHTGADFCAATPKEQGTTKCDL